MIQTGSGFIAVFISGLFHSIFPEETRDDRVVVVPTSEAGQEGSRADRSFKNSSQKALWCLFHPTLWLTIWGALFGVLLLISCAFAGGWEAFNIVEAQEAWQSLSRRECFVAATYEGFWSGCLLVYSFIALSIAYLFEGTVQGKLSIIFSLILLCFFFPALLYLVCHQNGAPIHVQAGGVVAAKMVPALLLMQLFGGIMHCKCNTGNEDDYEQLSGPSEAR
eukprot:gnl/TRDRNA2_/TRDRNA2_169015_c0_seq1.p1 gnl/TRDRNA2_/TRDRNA2_169015_c0~~gnl/TRDRNA2_/TRDRNA2_169015_c0_seq1.p1  ORF type:complete len:236 (+),score=20.27 gnl/TRDRNA2_/TRDRNA2_169015_c0_seq1:46-708(+)